MPKCQILTLSHTHIHRTESSSLVLHQYFSERLVHFLIERGILLSFFLSSQFSFFSMPHYLTLLLSYSVSFSLLLSESVFSLWPSLLSSSLTSLRWYLSPCLCSTPLTWAFVYHVPLRFLCVWHLSHSLSLTLIYLFFFFSLPCFPLLLNVFLRCPLLLLWYFHYDTQCINALYVE